MDAIKGADIAILARRKDKLDIVADEIRELGVRCLAVQCDVTDSSSNESSYVTGVALPVDGGYTCV